VVQYRTYHMQMEGAHESVSSRVLLGKSVPRLEIKNGDLCISQNNLHIIIYMLFYLSVKSGVSTKGKNKN
jgi:hypothetical protein